MRKKVYDPRFVRPIEISPLIADPTEAKEVLGWRPKTTFKKLVTILADTNLARLK